MKMTVNGSKTTTQKRAEPADFYDDELGDELRNEDDFDDDDWLDEDEEGPLTPEQQAEIDLAAAQILERNTWLAIEVQRHPGGDWFAMKIADATNLAEAKQALASTWERPPFDVRLPRGKGRPRKSA